MAQYKLYYYDARGVAEVSRMIMHYAGVLFEDVRLTPEQWIKFKPHTPFGELPVLEVDGVKIGQSCAIARFLAKNYGLAGIDDLEAAYVDSLGDQFSEFINATKEFLVVSFGCKNGINKEKLRKDVFLPAVEKYFPIFEKILSKSGNGFFAKSGVTWVDFHASSLMVTLKTHEKDIAEKYPALLKHSEGVNALPQLNEYIAIRKETTY